MRKNGKGEKPAVQDPQGPKPEPLGDGFLTAEVDESDAFSTGLQAPT